MVSNYVTGVGTLQLGHSLDIRHGYTMYFALCVTEFTFRFDRHELARIENL